MKGIFKYVFRSQNSYFQVRYKFRRDAIKIANFVTKNCLACWFSRPSREQSESVGCERTGGVATASPLTSILLSLASALFVGQTFLDRVIDRVQCLWRDYCFFFHNTNVNVDQCLSTLSRHTRLSFGPHGQLHAPEGKKKTKNTQRLGSKSLVSVEWVSFDSRNFLDN